VTGARFPVPGEYDGTGPDPAEGLRQALAVSADADVRLVLSMLVAGAKTLAGVDLDGGVTAELAGTAALFGWLSAVVTGELGRREALFGALGGPG